MDTSLDRVAAIQRCRIAVVTVEGASGHAGAVDAEINSAASVAIGTVIGIIHRRAAGEIIAGFSGAAVAVVAFDCAAGNALSAGAALVATGADVSV